MGNYLQKNKNADATKEERIYPEDEYVIKTRPPTMEGNTWKHNVQLKIREEQLIDEAMPVARYIDLHLGASAMTLPWNTSPAPKEKDFFGWSLTVKNSFSM